MREAEGETSKFKHREWRLNESEIISQIKRRRRCDDNDDERRNSVFLSALLSASLRARSWRGMRISSIKGTSRNVDRFSHYV